MLVQSVGLPGVLECMKVLQNYDVWSGTENFGRCPIFCGQLRCWWWVTYKWLGFGGIKGWEVCPTFLVRICLCGSLNIKHKHYDSNVNNRNDMLRKVFWADLRLRHSTLFMCCLSYVDFARVLMCFYQALQHILNCCMAMRDLWC